MCLRVHPVDVASSPRGWWFSAWQVVVLDAPQKFRERIGLLFFGRIGNADFREAIAESVARKSERARGLALVSVGSRSASRIVSSSH